MLDALAETAYKGPHQYAVTFGAQNFREALAKKTSPALHHEVDPNTEICVTCGGTEAMMAAMMTICNPGDKVMIFSPFYENYGADAILSGAEPIYIPLVPPTYEFDISLIEKGFAEGAKALILCNPSNPCGKVFRRDELEAIAKLAIQYDAFVVTDEVYEHIIYAPAEHICMASLPGMFEHTITCNSLSKTYSITGWRLGYLIGPAEVIEGARKVHDFLTVGAAAPLQEAAVAGLEMPASYYEELQALYTEKRDHFLAGLDRVGLKHNVPQGTYFVMIDISDFLALPQFKGWTDLQFCEWMIREVGVAAVPGSSFFREPVNHLIRMHFARGTDVLDEAVRRKFPAALSLSRYSIHDSSHGVALHGGHWLHKSGMHPLAVVQVALIHTAQQDLGGGNVGGNGYAVHIAQAEQILLGDAGGIRFQRVTEEQHQIHFVARNARSNLLHTAQAPGEITVHGQAGSLRQHPSGGAGSNNCVFGQNGAVSSAELQCKLFAGIVCKNGDRHIALSFVPSIVLCVTNNFLIGK